MKQHEAIGLALESELKTTTKLVLVTLIYKLDWETWEKPMSVSYIFKALGGQVSKSTISRALGDLQKLGVIRRYDTADRADGVRLIKLNTERLSTLCQPDIPPCQPDIPPMSERHTPSVTVTDPLCQPDIPPMSERHTPSVTVTDPLCQPDIPPMSERHTPSVTVTDNIISNNLIDNQNDNQSKQNPSSETRESLSGFSAFPPRPPRGTQTTQPRPRRYEDIAQQAQQTKRETYRVR